MLIIVQALSSLPLLYCLISSDSPFVRGLHLVNPINDEEGSSREYEDYRDDPTITKESNIPNICNSDFRIHNERWEGRCKDHQRNGIRCLYDFIFMDHIAKLYLAVAVK